MHPQPGVRIVVASMHTSIHSGGTGNIRHSPRNGFTTYFALSPGTGLSCPRHLADFSSAKLDTSVGVSGPHDFAVRPGSVRLTRHCGHRIPPRERDDRVSPLCWDGTGESIMLFLPSRQGKFLKIGNRIRDTIAPRKNAPRPTNYTCRNAARPPSLMGWQPVDQLSSRMVRMI